MTATEATKFAQQLTYRCEHACYNVDVVVCPPFTALRSVQVTLGFDSKSRILIGAQDVFWEESGAFTGAVSAAMLKDVACSFCIIGHSERREYFYETDEDVARKAAALLKVGISPLICCGESLEVRESGQAAQWVSAQVVAALQMVSAEDAKSVVLAYEPLWAIGTGRTPSSEQADEICRVLREVFAGLYGVEAADGLRILYGGSMNPGNVEAFAAMPNIDGGLVGGASLDADDFTALAKAFS